MDAQADSRRNAGIWVGAMIDGAARIALLFLIIEAVAGLPPGPPLKRLMTVAVIGAVAGIGSEWMRVRLGLRPPRKSLT
jgi:hypothetical protein